jgi:hypothetical protein
MQRFSSKNYDQNYVNLYKHKNRGFSSKIHVIKGFASDNQLKLLSECSSWHLHDTFKSSNNKCYRLVIDFYKNFKMGGTSRITKNESKNEFKDDIDKI